MFDTLKTRLRFRFDLWLSARLLPFRVRNLAFQELLALARCKGPTPYAGLPSTYIARRVHRAVRRPWLMKDRQCLRKGLLGFRFLCEAGFQPELRFAVDQSTAAAKEMAAHCWICIDGEPVIGAAGPEMVTVYTHKAPELSASPEIGESG